MAAVRALASDAQSRADVLPARPRPGKLRELALDPVEDDAELGHVSEAPEGDVVRHDDRGPERAEDAREVELLHHRILDPAERAGKCPERTRHFVNSTSRDSPWYDG